MTQLVLTVSNFMNLGVFADFFKSIKDSMARRAEVKRTMRELEACTDRELADMGIHRSEIYSVAMGHHDRCVKNENLKGWV